MHFARLRRQDGFIREILWLVVVLAILALARLVAEGTAMLRLAMEEQGGLRPDPDWMICNTADEYIAELRGRVEAEEMDHE